MAFTGFEGEWGRGEGGRGRGKGEGAGNLPESYPLNANLVLVIAQMLLSKGEKHIFIG